MYITLHTRLVTVSCPPRRPRDLLTSHCRHQDVMRGDYTLSFHQKNSLLGCLPPGSGLRFLSRSACVCISEALGKNSMAALAVRVFSDTPSDNGELADADTTRSHRKSGRDPSLLHATWNVSITSADQTLPPVAPTLAPNAFRACF
jgi:hypothetical protein